MLGLAWFKALAELRAEASRRYLGVLWWILEPLLYLLAFYLVFSVGLRLGGENYVPFLLCGLVPWKWFATTTQVGCNVISENRGLMNQVYFHKSMLVWMLMLVNFMKSLVVFALLLVALYFMDFPPSVTWLAFPAVLIAQFIIIAGIVALAASLVPFVPDLRLLIDNGVLILFFASGIFFNIAERPEHIQALLYLNPMAVVISSYRDILLFEQWPNWTMLGWSTLFGALLLALGLRFLHRFDRTYPKIII